jgi:glycosyltransferase involved in cell wall biosynthesis
MIFKDIVTDYVNSHLKISLVIPIKNESDSLAALIESIERQTFQPDEVVLVDGGSADDTVKLAEQFAVKNNKIKLVKTPQASPGKGRNIGTENSRNDWIAFTDAGIVLEDDWLEKLAKKVIEDGEIDIVYGNYAPLIDSFFKKVAMLSYVPSQNPGVVRDKTIVSYLMRKTVFREVGGFPDLRAAEDLIFMETAEKAGFRFAFAPGAMAHWQMRPNLSSTFAKFVLYSKFNVWAGRAWEWQHGVAKQYLFVLPFIVLAIFHSPFWLFGVLAWLAARTAKRILAHRFEFGIKTLFNPLIFGGVALLILTIDTATFIGWAQAILKKKEISVNS